MHWPTSAHVNACFLLLFVRLCGNGLSSIALHWCLLASYIRAVLSCCALLAHNAPLARAPFNLLYFYQFPLRVSAYRSLAGYFCLPKCINSTSPSSSIKTHPELQISVRFAAHLQSSP